MLRSLYSGVSGMKGFQTKLDVIGNNIANVNTVGYKKSRVVFQDVLSQTVRGTSSPAVDANPNVAGNQTAGGVNPLQIGLGSKVTSVDSIFSPGSPMMTNVSTDLYIDGPGFFVVQDLNGAQYLTRAGNFSRDGNGNLVTADGQIVLDNQGNTISIDPNTYNSFSIDKNGTIKGVDKQGNTVNLQTIGTVVVSNPGGLRKVGGSLYEITDNAGAGAISTNNNNGAGAIISGQLEMSNVDLTEEIAELISAQRGFQANTKIITVSDSILEEVINLKR
jgi:flagellar hook protein FlgE